MRPRKIFEIFDKNFKKNFEDFRHFKVFSRTHIDSKNSEKIHGY